MTTTTKIDISSLDSATKEKIEQYHKRCCELADIVKKPVTLEYKVGVTWSDLEPASVDMGLSDLYHQINKASEEFLAEIKKETAEIVSFADKVADQLGVDRNEFFLQYLAG